MLHPPRPPAQHETPEKVRNGVWVGDVFLYTNGANRLNYYVGGEVMTLAHLDRHMYMLGYLAKEGRVYLTDKSGAVVSYALLLAMVEYQTAVVRRDFAAANRILPDIPRDMHNSVAKFLEGQVRRGAAPPLVSSQLTSPPFPPPVPLQGFKEQALVRVGRAITVLIYYYYQYHCTY